MNFKTINFSTFLCTKILQELGIVRKCKEVTIKLKMERKHAERFTKQRYDRTFCSC